MFLYELIIGFRYLKSKKNQAFISFNTLLSIIIVFLGVFVLVVVTSVMNGFQAQIKDKILDVDSHLTVNGYDEETFKIDAIGDYDAVAATISEDPDVVSVMPYFQGQGILRSGDKIQAIFVRGAGDASALHPDLAKFVINGDGKFTSDDQIYIGEELAFSSRLQIGDQLELIVAKGDFDTRTGSTPSAVRFTVAGYFKTGYYEYDTRLLLVSLPAAQKLYGIENKVWGIGVKIRDVFAMDAVAGRIQGKLGYQYQVFTSEERNQNLFYALRLEKLIMTIILFLVILSAGFTIMGTLVMVVMEKRRAIGVLKSMGASQISIMTIFVLEGFLIGLIGTVSGISFGLAAAINLEAIIGAIENSINSLLSFISLTFRVGPFLEVSIVPKHVYYIDKIPTEIHLPFIIFIAVAALFLSTVSAVFPAWHASRLKPVEIIRYE